MLIIANTSSSQNKISIILVVLNTFNVKKNMSRAFTPKKLLGVIVFFFTPVKNKDENQPTKSVRRCSSEQSIAFKESFALQCSSHSSTKVLQRWADRLREWK